MLGDPIFLEKIIFIGSNSICYLILGPGFLRIDSLISHISP